MIWDRLTTEALAKVDRNCVVILPLAATEQHGPHLPLATDRLIAEGICREVNKRWDDRTLILPCPPIGYSAHHRSFSGTLSVSHSELMGYARGMLDCVFADGFTNLLILNAHGGNIALGGVLQESLGEAYPQAQTVFGSWWQLAAKGLLSITESGPGGVGHACEFETSLMLQLHPELVRKEKIVPGTNVATYPWAESDMLRGGQARLQRSMSQMTRNGVYGDPTAASAEKGARILNAVMDALEPILKDLYSKK
ncbi:MAG: creatininase family protein [Opitutales bacterium]|nr:creatininase family protein [Opitutales bacterium]